MTINEYYRAAGRTLAALCVESPQHEALLLCEKFFGINGRIGLITHGTDIPDAQSVQLFEEAVAQREHRPLQYILGRWEFCDMSLSVGEGVLVPREDTCALVDAAAVRMAGVSSPLILDLCAGSGAVGLALLRRFHDAVCVFVELSDSALPYLLENIRQYGGGRAAVLKGDVLHPENGFEWVSGHDDNEAARRALCAVFGEEYSPRRWEKAEFSALWGKFHSVCSNPPYIPTRDIEGLSREVRREPHMALDGGDDGLIFYRAIAEKWKQTLVDGGSISAEFGIDQQDAVSQIFVRENLGDIALFEDINGKMRAINGTLLAKKPQK